MPTTGDAFQRQFQRALLAMARELWVAKDRQRILEHVLAEKGVVVREVLDTYQPSVDTQASLDRECLEFIERITAEFSAPKE